MIEGIGSGRRPISLFSRLRMARDIARGMIFVHENSLVHRGAMPTRARTDARRDSSTRYRHKQRDTDRYTQTQDTPINTGYTRTHTATLPHFTSACALTAAPTRPEAGQSDARRVWPRQDRRCASCSLDGHHIHTQRNTAADTLHTDTNAPSLTLRLDFGFAQLVPKQLTKGTRLGSFLWMAPEVMLRKPFNHQCVPPSFLVCRVVCVHARVRVLYVCSAASVQCVLL